jgi:hypothetical protein
MLKYIFLLLQLIKSGTEQSEEKILVKYNLKTIESKRKIY